MIFDTDQVLEVASRIEDVAPMLRNDLLEHRILGQITELSRAQEYLNSDYYWRRLEQLVQDYSKVKTGKHA